MRQAPQQTTVVLGIAGRVRRPALVNPLEQQPRGLAVPVFVAGVAVEIRRLIPRQSGESDREGHALDYRAHLCIHGSVPRIVQVYRSADTRSGVLFASSLDCVNRPFILLQYMFV